MGCSLPARRLVAFTLVPPYSIPIELRTPRAMMIIVLTHVADFQKNHFFYIFQLFVSLACVCFKREDRERGEGEGGGRTERQ